MPYHEIRIATRNSPLALYQATLIQQQLQSFYPSLQISLLPMTTTGDKTLDHLAKIGGKGLFVKELEQALLEGRAELAVHSMKDVPYQLPTGLELAIICQRADHRDVFVSHKFTNLADLPPKAIIGTSSLRRQCQLKAIRPDLTINGLRGNIDTRLKKLTEQNYDGIVLAAAGLQRLQLDSHITQYLTISQMLPAAGQGAIGIECKADDLELKELIAVLADPVTTTCILAERSLTQILGGSCQVPLAAYCELDEFKQLSLRAMVGYPDGEIIIYDHQKGPYEQPQLLGQKVAATLVEQGAELILKAVNHD